MKNSFLYNAAFSVGELSAIADDLNARIKSMTYDLIHENETLSYSDFIYLSRRIVQLKKESASITKYLQSRQI